MSKEAILKIKEAEAEAERIRENAAAEAKERVRRAEKEGKQLLACTEEEALRVNAERLALTRKRADELLEQSHKDAEAEAQKICADSDERMDDAVRLIVEGVFEQCQ